jgi:leucyl/phenylalanyl-tRNA--protein transferase
MSAADPLAILARYAAGFFPLYDPLGRFYWERLSIRAAIPVSDQSLAAADKLARRSCSRFVLRRTHDVPAVIAHLRDETVKPRTWVRGEVVAIYRALHQVGLLSTVEAYDASTGKLAGALLGLILPGTFIAETMFSLAPNASKQCLCRLLHDAHAAGQRLIDVQTPHHLDETGLPRQLTGKSPHPCLRLGEEHWTIARFLRIFRAAWHEQFPGDLSTWLAAVQTLAATRRCPKFLVDQLSPPPIMNVPDDLLRAAAHALAPHFSAQPTDSPIDPPSASR